MNQPLLMGKVDDRDETVERLQRENSSLRSELRECHEQLRTAKIANEMALGKLRKWLAPQFEALKAVFGEMDAVLPTETASASPQADGRTKAVWDSWKGKLGGSCARVIDALLLHPNVNTTQLAIAAGMSRKSIPNIIFKLNQAGLINKNGGRFSLKEL